MKVGLEPGKCHRETLVVDASMIAKAPAAFGAAPIHYLLGTAALVEVLEWTSRQLLLPYLEPNEEGVGGAIEMRHLAGVPVGETVLLESTVLEVGERRLKTRIQASCKSKLVADGFFVQAIVSKDRLAALMPADVLPPQSSEISPDVAQAPEIKSTDGAYGLTIDLLDWESPYPCTPYDEWIHVRIRLRMPQGPDVIKILEAPCLLRFEVEAIAESFKRLLPVQKQGAGFASDFLDSRLRLSMQVDAQGQLLLGVTLEASDAAEAVKTVFPVDTQSAQLWCVFTTRRLAQLQALL